MTFLLTNGTLYSRNTGQWHTADMKIEDGFITAVEPHLKQAHPNLPVIDLAGKHVFPGLIDVHVHFREPGFSIKETIDTGSMAAAHGGFTHVCAMPNLNPVPDTLEHLMFEKEMIRAEARIHVYPYASITMQEKGEELSEMDQTAPECIAFSDDGKGVQNEEIMRKAMLKAAALHKIIAAHCEDNSLLHGGYIHAGTYAELHHHRGISSESEWKQIERDLKLAAETHCRYHVCHISTAESVDLIRKAKAAGTDVSCETCPHYLTLSDKDLQEDGRFKMNPPLRSERDRAALIEGLLDGTIDMIATDHAPHTAEEKSRGLEKSLMGVTGLECAFPVLYTELVRSGILPLEKLIELMHDNPSRRFGIGSELEPGKPADLCIFDLNKEEIIDPEKFLSKGKSTPFAGKKVFGHCNKTFVQGELVWQDA